MATTSLLKLLRKQPILWGLLVPFALMFAVSMPLCTLTGAGTGADRLPASPFRIGELCSDQAATKCESAWLYEGLIDKDFAHRLARAEEALSALPGATPVHWICLNSRGGSSFVAHEFASNLRSNGASTCVVPIQRADGSLQDSQCASACSAIWLGGTQRLLAGASTLGLHRGYIDDRPICLLPNCMAGALYGAFDAMAPLWMGEADKRWKLLGQALAYGPKEVFRLSADDAVRRGLQTALPAGSAWHWRAAPRT